MSFGSGRSQCRHHVAPTFRAYALWLCIAIALAGCNNQTQTPTGPTVTSVSVMPSTARLIVGQTQQFTATVAPTDAPQTVTWAAIPASVVSISTTGIVTGLAPGQATVTATPSGSSTVMGTALVTVTALPPPANPPFIAAPVLTVMNGANYLGDLMSVRVCIDSSCATPIASASVSVDNNALTYSSTKSAYTGSFTIPAGRTFPVKVTHAAFDYVTAVTQFTSFPTVTSPVSGTTWNAAQPNSTTWTNGAPTAGATNFLGVVNASGKIFYPSGNKPLELPIGTTSYTVPPGWTSTPGDYYFYVGIGTPGISNGGVPGLPIPNAAQGSGVYVGGILTFSLVHVF